MKELSLQRKTKIVTQKTVAKKTKEIEKINLKRVEANDTGVYVAIDELPGQVFKVMDELPAELVTQMTDELIKQIEDPTEVAKRKKK